MSDIFDEKQDIKNIKSFVARLHHDYHQNLHDNVWARSPEEIRLKSRLVTHWPGDEIVGQIVKDTIRLMIDNDMELSDLL